MIESMNDIFLVNYHRDLSSKNISSVLLHYFIILNNIFDCLLSFLLFRLFLNMERLLILSTKMVKLLST
jgi:hypothetical protein